MLIAYILAGLSLIYWILIVVYAGITADFAWIWPVISICLIAGGYFFRWIDHNPNTLRWVYKAVTLLIITGVLIFGILTSIIMTGMHASGSKDLEYVIVLGAQVRGTTPSRALEKRLNKALSYAEENPETLLILSGGKGSGEDISEAACMKEWLTAHGIEESRLIIEDQSTSTHLNLVYSNELTGCSRARTGILTNDFHVSRALMIAKKCGYLHSEGIAAEGDPLMEVHYVVREVFAMIKAKLTGRI